MKYSIVLPILISFVISALLGPVVSVSAQAEVWSVYP